MADMDIYVGMLHARQAAEHLLITHVERRNGNVVGEELTPNANSSARSSRVPPG